MDDQKVTKILDLTRTVRVVQAVNKFSNMRFKYGTMDCCMFAARVADEAILQRLHFSDLFKYSTMAEAKELVEQHGGLVNMISKLTGSSCVDKAETLDGDPILIKSDVAVIGVRLGSSAVYKTEQFIGSIELTHKFVRFGWRI